jgi:hypothetical protein
MLHPTTHPLLLLCVWAAALLLAAQSVGAAPRVQVFGFSPEQKLPTYKGYPWDLLTTTAWRTDPELVQLASTHGTIVEVFGGQGAELMPHLGSEAKRKKWVSACLWACTAALPARHAFRQVAPCLTPTGARHAGTYDQDRCNRHQFRPRAAPQGVLVWCLQQPQLHVHVGSLQRRACAQQHGCVGCGGTGTHEQPPERE